MIYLIVKQLFDMDRQENQLCDEQFATQQEIITKLDTLIAASWDSPTLKKELTELVKQYYIVTDELCRIWDKQKQ